MPLTYFKCVDTLLAYCNKSIPANQKNRPFGLERNDFIIEKQKAELQRMDAAKRHKEEQINLAEQELKQVKSEIRTDARIIDKAFRWFPMFREMLRMEKFCAMLGFSKEMTESLIVKKEALKCSGKIYSEQHRRNFDIKDDILRVENDPDDESRLNLTINRKPIADWFREQWHRLRYGARVPQQEERKSRGFKL